MSHGVNKFMLGLFSLMFLSATALFGASQYEEKVVIPKYNPNDPTHVLITPSNGKWNRYVLNDPNKRHFYVKPGKYHTRINLTRSGTKNSRRTLSLYNGNNKHPASLPISQVADVRLWFKGADYWIIDRLSNINDTTEPSFQLYNSATHNILNQLHIKDYYYGIIIEPYSHYNSIQNSYLDNMTHKGRLSDNVGIAIHNKKNANAVTVGTKIINNDIRNANDGIQTVVSSKFAYEKVSCEGTIIDSNRIWMDGDVYTNGDYSTNGYNQNGKYQIGEQAIDLKAGSTNSLNPVIITNNILWGYHKTDPTIVGSLSKLEGTAFVFTNGITNVKIDSNIIFDSQRGLQIANAGTKDIDIKNNIFYELNKVNPDDDKTYASFVYNSTNVTVANNTYVNIPTNSLDKGVFFKFENTKDSKFVNNIAISSYGAVDNRNNIIDNNYFYNSKESFKGTREHHFNSAVQAKMTDYTFTYERFTTHPKRKTLKGVITTKNSPHYGKVGAVLQPSTPPSNTIVYEDAEDGKTTGWEIYDKSPSGATISNFYDAQKRSFVIELDGQGINNGYRLGSAKAGTAFNNKKNTHIQWKMNYNESFIVYISVQTTKGFRYLYYTVSNKDKGLQINPNSKTHYIHHGLDVKVRNGTWQTVTRDLAKDIKDFEPDNDLLSVNGFLIRGSGKVDDIKMFGTKVSTPNIITYEDAQDGKINGWDVYDNTPAGAQISNVYDAQKRSRVIKFDGSGTKNGYRFDLNNNLKDKIFSWRMKYYEKFSIYIALNTTRGTKYLLYTPENINKGLSSNGRYIYIGLGTKAKNGVWQKFTRDLQVDLQKFDNGNKIISVNTFLIRGSGKIDDIQMSDRF